MGRAIIGGSVGVKRSALTGHAPRLGLPAYPRYLSLVRQADSPLHSRPQDAQVTKDGVIPRPNPWVFP